MAEEDLDGAAEVVRPRRPPSGPGRYFALVVLLLMLEGALGYWFVDQIVPAPEEPEPETEEEIEEEAEVWIAPIFYQGLKDLMVEPTAFRGNRLVQISLALEVDAASVTEELQVRHKVIWDLVLRRLERMSWDDFRDPEKKVLKADLLRTVNAELKNPGVLNIYVTSVVMQ